MGRCRRAVRVAHHTGSAPCRDRDRGAFSSTPGRPVQAAVVRATGIEGADAQALRKWSRGSGTALIADLLNSLEDLSQDLVLVLDDYHLAESAEVDESVTYLLEHLPSRVRVLMTTRSDPALPLARLRVRGQLLEVRAGDLRFTEQEAGSYLAETAGLELKTCQRMPVPRGTEAVRVVTVRGGAPPRRGGPT
jgi:hypothetical protein